MFVEHSMVKLKLPNIDASVCEIIYLVNTYNWIDCIAYRNNEKKIYFYIMLQNNVINVSNVGVSK